MKVWWARIVGLTRIMCRNWWRGDQNIWRRRWRRRSESI